MIPTFVFGWPTGKETGDYLALDLGTSSSLYVPLLPPLYTNVRPSHAIESYQLLQY